MKYAIIIMDGAADEPLAELNGQTVLQKAHTPNTDWISSNGRLGLVYNVPNGFAPGSDIALMSVLGYDPNKYYSGRAPLEAAAKSISTGVHDWIFRCNLVTVADEVMQDYSAGHIGSTEAATLIDTLNDALGTEQITFYAGVGYRHLMVYRNEEFDIESMPPHDIMDQPISKNLPRGKKAKELVKIMEQAEKILAEHEINKVRQDLGENPATNIWLWGQGKRPQMDGFRQRFGIKGSVITGVDLMRGLGKLTGMKVIEVEGATGYLDTNYAGKGQNAITALADHDLIVVHIEAPDEAGHGAMVESKVESIEKIDNMITGPMLKWLQEQEDGYRIMVLPDHPTPVRLRTHTSEPVPFAMAGADINSASRRPYSEKDAEENGLKIEKGHDLMEFFLKKE